MVSGQASAASGPDDASLVAAARSGDRAAFGLLVSRHRPALVGACRRFLGARGPAEDAAQEACLLALLNLEQLRRPDRFGAWLIGIGLNVARQWLRRPSERAGAPGAFDGGTPGREPVDPAMGPEEVAEARDLARRVRAAVGDLPPGQRDPVLLYYAAGLPVREVAALLGTGPQAVKTRLHRARSTLRGRLRETWRETWKEERTEEARADGGWVEMEVVDVLRGRDERDGGERFVVVLRQKGGGRGLPIWIGPSEGRSIALLLERSELPRPGSSHFASRLLAAAGSRLARTRIVRLAESTYYAEAWVEGAGGSVPVDARPSDAIALALLVEAPIEVSTEVLDAVEGTSGSLGAFEGKREAFAVGAADIAEEVRREQAALVERCRADR